MSDMKKTPADGGGVKKGEPDGVSAAPDSGEAGDIHGRVGGGESGGGSYPNPHSGKSPEAGGFLGHGGQSEHEYHGGSNPNATTGDGGTLSEGQTEARVSATPVRDAHAVEAGQQSFDVVEDNGVAAAEATGRVGKDAAAPKDELNDRRSG